MSTWRQTRRASPVHSCAHVMSCLSRPPAPSVASPLRERVAPLFTPSYRSLRTGAKTPFQGRGGNTNGGRGQRAGRDTRDRRRDTRDRRRQSTSGTEVPDTEDGVSIRRDEMKAVVQVSLCLGGGQVDKPFATLLARPRTTPTVMCTCAAVPAILRTHDVTRLPAIRVRMQGVHVSGTAWGAGQRFLAVYQSCARHSGGRCVCVCVCVSARRPHAAWRRDTEGRSAHTLKWLPTGARRGRASGQASALADRVACRRAYLNVGQVALRGGAGPQARIAPCASDGQG